ncbi:AAA domain-containing protein [Streptomyces sp. NPDC006296]|uniref:AAA domain-containing protein n=1 Tax=Streptomyces sp. NPDC006296 TaxID=3156746 RepID=UPI0033B8FE69
MNLPIIADRFALPSSPVSEGGHAKLFKAADLENDNSSVAVKIFNPSKVLDDRVLQAAWTNELSAYQALGDHANLARLIDWGRCNDGCPYLVFEWLDQDLLAALDDLQIEGWDDFWPVAREILSGLAVIHAEGFVHRDVKPENILMSATGGYKVADFGTTRLAETVSLGLTMAPLGTVPYSPQERGTRTPTASYDLYSFAVLVLVCLTGRVPADEENVLSGFANLDLPPEIAKALAPCLSDNPDDRPPSAGVLKAQLEEIQSRREMRRAPEVEIFLDFPDQVLQAFLKQYNVSMSKSQVLDDIREVGALAFDGRAGAKPDLQLCGQRFMLRLQEHRTRPGLLRVVRVQRAPAQVLELARSTWYRPRLKLRTSSPTDARNAARELTELLELVTEKDGERAQREAAAADADAFSPWRSSLNAKFALENERGVRVKYDQYRRDGSRVRFRVEDATGVEIGEARLIREGSRRVLFGEVEGIENNDVILYVTSVRGGSNALPRRGYLEFDSEASKSKLKREKDALDRITNRRSVRADLRDILLDPRKSAVPQSVTVEAYIQQNLDEAKKAAVAASLGARDFLLVQGPPGTGKTTFIAEMVAQHLRRSPQARIVLTSQTHIALDNALMRIAELDPSVVLLRLGRADRLAKDVEPLSVPTQMDYWRQSVVEQSRLFIKEYAARLGIDLDSADLKNAATDLQRRHDRVQIIEQKLRNSQEERRKLVSEIDRVNAMAAPLLEVASTIEAAAGKGVGTDLSVAAERFIEVGLDLASKLETGGPLGQRLVEMEALLVGMREELKLHKEQRESIRNSLVEGLASDPNLATDDLIATALKRSAVDDPRLASLQRIASEWEERFGRGKDFTAVLIARAQVVAATCVGLTGVPGADTSPFDLCIIDEASKATATEALVPLANSRKWVLVGDDKQLPPFVEKALEEPALLDRYKVTRQEMRETLFSALSERLPEPCRFSLTHQHRMHPSIGQLVSHSFYDDTLTSEPRQISPVIERALGATAVWLDTSSRTDRRENRAGKSVKNKGEARAIAKLLDRLQWVAKQQSTEPLSVAVLTGYEAQRREIVETLAPGEFSRDLLKVRVATVDSYQGQEADVAIFSVTRSNERDELGFLRSEERVNVAVSRARDSLVIVGDAGFIDSVPDIDNPLRRVLSYMRRSADCTVEMDAS